MVEPKIISYVSEIKDLLLEDQTISEQMAQQIVRVAMYSDSFENFCRDCELFGKFENVFLGRIWLRLSELICKSEKHTPACPSKLDRRESDTPRRQFRKTISSTSESMSPILDQNQPWLDKESSSKHGSPSERNCEKRNANDSGRSMNGRDISDEAPTDISLKERNSANDAFSDLVPKVIFFERVPQFLETKPKPSSVQLVNVFKDQKSTMANIARNGSELVRERLAKRERENQVKRSACGAGTTLGNLMALEEKTKFRKSEKRPVNISITSTKEDIKRQKENLPIFAARSAILSLVRENQVVILLGETGSGKTTQVAQYLHEDAWTKKGIVGCTQPRRVAAISVAERVSAEMNVQVGTFVGYSIRFEDKTSPDTRIKYMTSGILLRESLSQPSLDKYSCLIIDEAHERSLNSDILLGLLKRILRSRLDLRLIITSATINTTLFSKYFGNAPIYEISGRTFPVHIHHVLKPVDDYVAACVKQILAIHLQQENGDILVFLSGQEDIFAAQDELLSKLKWLDNTSPLEIVPLYSQLSSDLQTRIFQPSAEGTRRVVLATNIAETSLTVEGIRYVVDSGFAKFKVYQPQIGMDTLQLAPISLASAAQRSGRAGRLAEGHAYRMYTSTAEKTEMYLQPVPEILRCNLTNTVLLLKSLGVEDIYEFEFLDRPSDANITASLYDLWALGALDTKGHLTVLGKRFSQFPLDPYLARLVIEGIDRGCIAEVLVIVAMISVWPVFHRPLERALESDRARERFIVQESDHLTLLNVYEQCSSNNFSERWCVQNFIHYRAMVKAREIKKQLSRIVSNNVGVKITSIGNNLQTVKRCICAAFFHHAARAKGLQSYVGLRIPIPMNVHPTSALHGQGSIPEYVVYNEVIMTPKRYMMIVTAVEPQWLLEDGTAFYQTDDTALTPTYATQENSTPDLAAKPQLRSSGKFKPRKRLMRGI